MELTIKNYNLRRKWGWGVTTGWKNDNEMETPGVMYSGTINQIQNSKNDDRAYQNSISNAYQNSKIFYDGQIVDAVWGMYPVHPQRQYDPETDGDYRVWQREYWNDTDFEYGWLSVKSFESIIENAENSTVKIKLVDNG